MLCLCQLIFLSLRVCIKLIIPNESFKKGLHNKAQQCSISLKLWVCLLWKFISTKNFHIKLCIHNLPLIPSTFFDIQKSVKQNDLNFALTRVKICPNSEMTHYVFVFDSNMVFNSLARFVFIIGTSVVLAFNSMHRKGVPWLQLLRKVTWRTIVLMLIGFCFMNYSPRDGFCE